IRIVKCTGTTAPKPICKVSFKITFQFYGFAWTDFHSFARIEGFYRNRSIAAIVVINRCASNRKVDSRPVSGHVDSGFRNEQGPIVGCIAGATTSETQGGCSKSRSEIGKVAVVISRTLVN